MGWLITCIRLTTFTCLYNTECTVMAGIAQWLHFTQTHTCSEVPGLQDRTDPRGTSLDPYCHTGSCLAIVQPLFSHSMILWFATCTHRWSPSWLDPARQREDLLEFKGLDEERNRSCGCWYMDIIYWYGLIYGGFWKWRYPRIFGFQKNGFSGWFGVALFYDIPHVGWCLSSRSRQTIASVRSKPLRIRCSSNRPNWWIRHQSGSYKERLWLVILWI